MKKRILSAVAALLMVLIYIGYRWWYGEMPACLEKQDSSKPICNPSLVHDTREASPFFGQADVWARPGLPLKDAVAFLKDAGYRCKLPEDESGQMPTGKGEISITCANKTGEGLLGETTQLTLDSHYEIKDEQYYEALLEPALIGIEANTIYSATVPGWLRRLLARFDLVPPVSHRVRGWTARSAEHLASALRLDVAYRLPLDVVTNQTRALREPYEVPSRLRLGLQPVGQALLPAAHVCQYVDVLVSWGMQAETPGAGQSPRRYWYERPQWRIEPVAGIEGRPFTIRAAWVGKDLSGEPWRAELVAGPSGAAESLTLSVGGDTRRFAIEKTDSVSRLSCDRGWPKRPVLAAYTADGRLLDTPKLYWAQSKRQEVFAANARLWPSLAANEAERLLRDFFAEPIQNGNAHWPTGKARMWQMIWVASEIAELSRLEPPYYFDPATLERLRARTHADHRLVFTALALAPCGLTESLAPPTPWETDAAFVAPSTGPECLAALRRQAPAIAQDLMDWWAAVKRDDEKTYSKTLKVLHGLRNQAEVGADLTSAAQVRLLVWMKTLLDE